MTVSWTLKRERICDKALEKCQRLGIGRTVSADDRNLCIEALDSILKNLLWYGYSWPKRASGSTPLSFIASQQTQALPQDYYDSPTLTYTATGTGTPVEVPFKLYTPEEWANIPSKTLTATYPYGGFIDNANVLWLYPIPNAALTVNLYYNKVISDTVGQNSTDLDSPWMIGLAYGVAAEVGDEFGVDPQKIARFEAKWHEQRSLGIRAEAPPGPDRMTVSD